MLAAVSGLAGLSSAACQRQTVDTSRPDSARALGGSLSGDPATLQQDDGQWVMPAKNYASTRFSGLDEINAQTVVTARRVLARSRPAWLRGHEAAPLVVDSTMYVVTPFPNSSTRSTSSNRARR